MPYTTHDQRSYQQKNRGLKATPDNTIRSLVSIFDEQGTVGNHPHIDNATQKPNDDLYC